MSRFLVRRFLLLLLVMLGISVMTFTVSRVIPKNVAWVWAGFQGFKPTPELIAAVEKEYHLKEPYPVQYWYYMSSLLRGDLGRSPVSGRRIAEGMAAVYPNTVELGAAAMFLAIAIGVPLGVLSATKRNSIVDHAARLLALVGVSVPAFWLGLVMQLVFYFGLGWVSDPGGRLSDAAAQQATASGLGGFVLFGSLAAGQWQVFLDALRHLVMPAVVLALSPLAVITRMTRSTMLDILKEDYIRTARAKGVSDSRVNYRHALRNAMIPTTTVLGLSFAWLMTGSVVTEVVFYWPGLGQYAVNAIVAFDFPAIMAFVLLASVVFVLVNLFTDIAYMALDPRVRYD